MNYLSKKRTDNPDVYTKCSLMIDAMAVRQQIEYDSKTGKMVGFVDLGQQEGEEGVMAKEALVFLAVGLRGNWKIPIAYFFTRTVSAQLQAQLIKHALCKLHEAGLKVHVITMDGHASNVSMVKLLGCSLEPYKLKTYFEHPSSKEPVYIMFDACHMLKLVRNMLEAYRLLVGSDGKISWEYVKELQKVQVCCVQLHSHRQNGCFCNM